MKTHTPSIFEYNDFRTYLDDFQKARFEIDKTFTRSALCRKLGIAKTRSYYGDVVAGKFVSSAYVGRFIKVLELNKEEAQFFRVLVKFNQADEPDEHELYFEQLIALNRTPKRILDPKVHIFYKVWYHSIIRTILDIYDFNGSNYASLARKVVPSVTVKQAKESIALLEELELIKQNGEGFYKPTDKAITTNDFVRDELIKQYQVQCLEMAKKTLIKKVKPPHEISTNVISISEVGFKRLQKRLGQFKAEVRSLVNKDENPADRVYQLNIQLFPSSKINSNGKHSG